MAELDHTVRLNMMRSLVSTPDPGEVAMDIPNDLNNLLARLKQVTTEARPVTEAWASGPRPSASEVDFFLSQYGFDSDAVIERIEITKDGEFEFYMFAALNRFTDDLSLLAMWP
jgi:hypothetical protein